MSDTFEIDGIELPYYTQYNDDPRCVHPGVCERTVELPIGYHFYQYANYQRDNGRFLEVGNVLDWWYEDAKAGVTHDSVDLFEQREGVVNCDILEWSPDYSYDRILSLSTLEHVGLGEYGDTGGMGKAIDAVVHCVDLLAPGGQLLFTIPRGHNDALEEALLNGVLRFLDKTYMYRVGAVEDNDWVQTSDWEDIRYKTEYTTYSYANAIYVVQYKKRA